MANAPDDRFRKMSKSRLAKLASPVGGYTRAARRAQAELERRRTKRREFFKWVSLAIAGIAAIATVALAINALSRME
jgi:hypothetical protein